MKLTFSLLFVVALLPASAVFAQEGQPAQAPPAGVQIKPIMPAKPAAAPDAIKGNAAKDVSIVSAVGSCPGAGMKPIGIINKSANGKAVMVKIELTANYSGHVSKKNSIIDNIAPNETRFIGCSGCTESASGQNCSSYKILAAVYK